MIQGDLKQTRVLIVQLEFVHQQHKGGRATGGCQCLALTAA